MRKSFQILLVIVTLLITLCAEAQTNEITVPLSDPGKRGKLKAHLNSGSITIKGTARKDILVRYTEVNEDDEDVEENEDSNRNRDRNHEDEDSEDTEKPSKAGLKRIGGGGIDLEITENSNNVKVQSDSWNRPIKLEIEIPSGFDVQLHTYNDGSLMISNIQGALELTNYNDEITALNISGSVVANTYNGDIRVTFDKVTPDTPMSFSTFNGDVDISFPSTVKAALKLKTEQGSIYSDFDVTLKSTGPVKTSENKGGMYKVKVDEWKHGTINGGGPEITMRNYNGDIILRKKG
jgi:hypothetical protein